MLLAPRLVIAGLIATALTPMPRASAQTAEIEEPTGVRIFEPEYYAEFDPVSALEMVFRTPGFNPQEQDGGRGLSGVRSNILINGERPPPKGQSIRQQLRETPVDGVERIELIDAGARLDIDMQGYPQVVNVVTVADAPAYYEFSTQFHRAGTGDPQQDNQRNTELEAIGSFSWGGHEFTMRGDLRDGSFKSPADFVTIDPANPEQRITSLNSSERDDHGIQLGAIFRAPGDSSVTFNGRFSGQTWSSSPISLIEDEGPLAVDQTSDSEDDRHDISAEYRRPFGAGGTLMLAFVDAESEDRGASSLTSSGVTRSSFENRQSGETAARVLLTQVPTERLTVRTTATNAFNYFEGGFRLFEDGVEQSLAGSDSRVEEDRRSIDASVDWNLTDRLTFRGTLGAESYEIESHEVSSGLQTDPKGNLSIAFRPEPRTTLSFESRREIGQLSFSQFLASSNLSSEILTAGASELEPVRRWVHVASYDKRFGDVGVMRVDLSRQDIDNPINSVALSDALVVAQNTSSATIDRLRASVEFPFERFGREDLILSLEGMVSQSETIDPITGETREVSGNTKRFWSIGLRRDPGDSRLAFGMSIGDSTQGVNYSVRRIRSSASAREWGAYVEWEAIDGLKLRAEINGPQTSSQLSSFFGSVRAPDLSPTFLSSTLTTTDRSGSLSVEWRRHPNFEIRASFSTRPKIRTIESLIPYGDAAGSLLATEIATTPRATLRFRYYR